MEEKIIAIIAGLFDRKPEELTAGTLLKENLNAASINLLEISAMVENELGLDIPMDRIIKVKSIGDIINLVAELSR